MSKLITIKSKELTVEISTLGAELRRIYDTKGTEFLWDGNPEFWTGRAPILFPICGGLKNGKYSYSGKEYQLTKHGFARRSEFETEAVDESSAVFLLKSNAETKASYPFDFEFRVSYKLKGRSLSVKYSVTNPSDGEILFSFGSHEAYACPDGIENYEIVFEKEENLDSLCIVDNLLTGESVPIIKNETTLPLDYKYFEIDALCFKDIKSRKVSLNHKLSDRKTVIEFDNFEYFLLWTKPKAGYLCIELNAGIDDIVGSSYELSEKAGIIRLNGKETFELNHVISFYA